MQKKQNVYLTLGLGTCSATLLIDRFIVTIPDWLGITFGLIAAGLLTKHMFNHKK